MKYEDLKILDELREKGSISEEEYQREKAKILNDEGSTGGGFNGKPLFGMNENSYLMLMHLSQFAGIIIPLAGFVVPVLMWITNKETNVKVDMHGKNILNFMISYVLYAAVLSITVIGIPLAVLVGLLYVVFVILASVKANNGEYWKYPFTIQFIK
ncbi:MAG: DUF4870 domain-containing protein [Porphyromonadaceae bacterium]|nr:DUF4870 domain-containing protein [Porphyromonadaceae bacterium]